MKRHYLICFDISENKRRRKVVKLLLNSGKRVQKSVFECLLDDQKYIKLKNDMDRKIDKKTDSIRYYCLCKNCIPNIQITGLGFYTEPEDVIVI